MVQEKFGRETEEELLGLTEAGRLADLSAAAIKYHVEQGHIPAIRGGGARLIRRADAERFARERAARRGVSRRG